MNACIWKWKEGTTGNDGHWELIPVYFDIKGRLVPMTSASGTYLTGTYISCMTRKADKIIQEVR